MLRVHASLIAPLCLFAASPHSAAHAADPAGPSIPHERYQLANGLDVVIAPDDATPTVHVEVWYHVGSKDERKGRTGFAHLFEHLMFQGSLNADDEYFTPFQAVGASINGTTNVDRTNYYQTLPASHLPLALFMEGDRMGNLLPALTLDKLDNQREVVRNERRQRYENPPYGEAWVDLMAALHPVGHPYHHPTIGSHEDLEAATLDDVRDFFNTWYVPSNATLVIVGDVDIPTTKQLVQKHFGWIPKAKVPATPLRDPAPVALPESVVIDQRQDVPEHRLWAAWHSPPHFAPGDAELDVLADVLCGGDDGRLIQALVKTQRVARTVSCGQVSRSLGSFFLVTATAADGFTTPEVMAAADAVLEGFFREAPATADEVATAQAQIEASMYRRLSTVAGRSGLISTFLNALDTADAVAAQLHNYQRVTPDAVMQVGSDVLRAPRVELHIGPPIASDEESN